MEAGARQPPHGRTHDSSRWRHGHDFGTPAEQHAERRTHWVVVLTFVTMLVELAAGWRPAG